LDLPADGLGGAVLARWVWALAWSPRQTLVLKLWASSAKRGEFLKSARIIGLAIALVLRQRGHEVCVLDGNSVAAEASRGNAGTFAFSDIMPLAPPRSCAKCRDGC
jgi:D-amino-acid dehydrogenase